MNPAHKKTKSIVASGIFDKITCFSELEDRISKLPTNKDKGDAFEVFAEAYLATQKITQAKNVWSFEAAPISILEKFSLNTKRDMGVDGIVETHQHKYSAYQVKFRSERSPLTWDELSTFMGLADFVDERILFTNSVELPELMNQRKSFYCIRGTDLDRLEKKDFQIILQFLSGNVRPSIRKSPLPHQKEAIGEILPALQSNERVTSIMACGSGKTLVALWCVEKLACKNIIVMVPSLALLRQTLHEWMKEITLKSVSYLCVCSDKTVNKVEDELEISQSDLDFPVTTDSLIIKKFCETNTSSTKIVFSTYQSLAVVAKALQGDNFFDFGIFDEAHKTAGRSSYYNLGLTNSNIFIKKRLFLTATPRHYNPHKKNKEGEAKQIFSMDKPDIYGQHAFTLTFADAAKRNIICNYKIIISLITSEDVNNDLLKSGVSIVNGESIKAKQVANQIAVREAVNKYGVDKILTFHKSVASAKSFSSKSAAGIQSHLPNIETFHVNGKMPTGYRDKIMKSFQLSKKSLITNARCLTEGVDMPAIDMVCFLSPKRSRVDIVQAAGRAMRKSPGKSNGYILIPLYVEVAKGETVEEAIERAEFGEIWDVLQAMQEQDSVLEETIQSMNVERGKSKGFNDSTFSGRVSIESPLLTLDALTQAITTKCISRIGSTWDYLFGQLTSFKEQHQHCNVTIAENELLGRWVSAQRVHWKKGNLSKKQEELLEGLGFDWDYQKTKAGELWKEYFRKLSEFKDIHGHCNVVKADDESLAGWAGAQRGFWKNGKLTKEQEQLLEGIDFDWDYQRSKANALWNEYYKKLTEYKTTYGDVNVPRTFKDSKLANWVWIQRQRKRGKYKKSVLTEKQVLRLDRIGFSWEAHKDKWDDSYKKLNKYFAINDHFEVPKDDPQLESLATWIQVQRNNYSQGQLSKRRMNLLEKISFPWQSTTRDNLWWQKFEELEEYRSEFKHCNVPSKWAGNPALSNWVNVQREKYKKSKLEKDKVDALESLDFKWSLRVRGTWEDGYEQLIEFKSKYGHCDVPFGYSENKKLGQWVNAQRNARKVHKLSKNRIAKLESIGFRWVVRQKWEQMFSQLVKYKEKHGHCNFPTGSKDNPELGGWISTQRTNKRKNKLDLERIQKLESIGFLWAADQKGPRGNDSNWEKQFEELSAFKKKFGHTNVSTKDSTYSKLGRWVSKQRALKKKNKLTLEREQKMDSLNFVWALRK